VLIITLRSFKIGLSPAPPVQQVLIIIMSTKKYPKRDILQYIHVDFHVLEWLHALLLTGLSSKQCTTDPKLAVK